MQFGVVFPQTEFDPDPALLRDYAQTVEGLGFAHILAYDHILGANPDRPGGWNGPYTHESAFLEPLVLFSFMAAVTHRLQFTTGIIILPQRQTAVFAKQAATLDVLTGGRLRLGLGLGWNQVEYTALNQDFHTRGRRIEEQVAVLRALWTRPLVSFSGRWHTILDAGLKPLPVQRPIPLWFGGHADAVLRRVAELGDGWMPDYRRAAEAQPSWEKIQTYRAAAGRNAAQVGLEARLLYGDGDPDAWHARIAEWQALGATHISFNTMRHGFVTPAAHLAALESIAQVIL